MRRSRLVALSIAVGAFIAATTAGIDPAVAGRKLTDSEKKTFKNLKKAIETEEKVAAERKAVAIKNRTKVLADNEKRKQRNTQNDLDLKQAELNFEKQKASDEKNKTPNSSKTVKMQSALENLRTATAQANDGLNADIMKQILAADTEARTAEVAHNAVLERYVTRAELKVRAHKGEIGGEQIVQEWIRLLRPDTSASTSSAQSSSSTSPPPAASANVYHRPPAAAQSIYDTVSERLN